MESKERQQDYNKPKCRIEPPKQTVLRSQSNFEQDPKGFYDMCEFIRDGIVSPSVDCSKNNATAMGCKILAPAIARNRSLIELNLSENAIESLGVIELCNVLSFNRSLHTLILRDNAIGPDGFEALASVLENNNTLTHLDMYHNLAGNAGFESLSRALKQNTSLTHLNLFWNKADDEGFSAIAEALQYNRTLKYLNMAHNASGYRGFELLAYALVDNPSVTTLILSDNSAGVKGFRAFGELLQSNKVLKTVHLSRNLCGATGLTSLCKGLISNNTLECITLSGNQGGSKGSHALAEVIAKNVGLTALDASFNSFGNQGLTSIADALRFNKVLRNLHLGSNQAGDDGLRAISLALRWNNSIEYLDLKGNALDQDTTKLLNESLLASLTLQRLEIDQDADSTQLDRFAMLGPHDEDSKESSSQAPHAHRLASLSTPVSMLQRQPTIIRDKGFLADQLMQEKVDLSSLSYRDEKALIGAQLIANEINSNVVCLYLDLSNNSFKYEGCETILRALFTNNTIKYLNLDLNQVEKPGLGHILSELLLNNTSLEHINLSRNCISSSEIHEIISVLKQRKYPNFILDIYTPHYRTQKLIQSVKMSPSCPYLCSEENNIHTKRLSIPKNPIYEFRGTLIFFILIIFLYPLYLPYLWFVNTFQTFREIFQMKSAIKEIEMAKSLNKSLPEVTIKEPYFCLRNGLTLDDMTWEPNSPFHKKYHILFIMLSILYLALPFFFAFYWLDSEIDPINSFFCVGMIFFITFIISCFTLYASYYDKTLRNIEFPSHHHRLLSNKTWGLLDYVTILSGVLDVFQIMALGFLEKEAQFPPNIIISKVFSVTLLSSNLDKTGESFWLIIIIAGIGLWLFGFLHMSILFNRPDMIEFIPQLGLITRLFSQTFFVTIVVNLVRWLDCTYTGGLMATLDGGHDMGGSWTSFPESSNEGNLICWNPLHASYASIAIVFLLLYFVVSSFISVFFLDNFSNGALIHFSPFYLMTEKSFKLLLVSFAVLLSSYHIFVLTSLFIIELILYIITFFMMPSDALTGNAVKLCNYGLNTVSLLIMIVIDTSVSEPTETIIPSVILFILWFVIIVIHVGYVIYKERYLPLSPVSPQPDKDEIQSDMTLTTDGLQLTIDEVNYHPSPISVNPIMESKNLRHFMPALTEDAPVNPHHLEPIKPRRKKRRRAYTQKSLPAPIILSELSTQFAKGNIRVTEKIEDLTLGREGSLH